MEFLTIWDFILLPLYLILFNFLANLFKKKYVKDVKLKYYFNLAFRIKMVICLVFTFLSVFMIGGDSLHIYFFEGRHFAGIIRADFFGNIHLLFTQAGDYIQSFASEENRPALWAESNYLIVKMTTFLCLIGFSSLMFVNLFIAFIAFLGSWQLFMFFRGQNPVRELEYALACLAVPTVIFWSSGIGKDAVCVASIGFLAKSLSDIFLYRKKMILNAVISALAIYCLITVKPYILYSLIPFLLFYILVSSLARLKNALAKFLVIAIFTSSYIALAFYLYANGSDIFKQYSSEKVMTSIKTSQTNFTNLANVSEGSYFTLGDFDGSFEGLLKLAPLSIGTTFFRPFLWECRNLIMVFSALESLLLLWLTLRNFSTLSNIKAFFKNIFTNKLVIFCICFSLVFAMFVGISSFNFGSLARYKIPCIPFLVCALLTIKPIRKPVSLPS